MKKHFVVMMAFCLVAGSFYAQKKKSEKTQTSPPSVDAVEGLNLGNKAPEIEMMDPAGQIVKLSSLKGKVVLIDFWASWCRPCRMENPNVVAAYNKYKDQKFRVGNGYTVLSVSLDQNKEAWQYAIQVDGLVWPAHVSDLLGWNNAAALKYGVGGIPTNYLINGDGIIIGKALRGPDLEKALEDQLAK